MYLTNRCFLIIEDFLKIVSIIFFFLIIFHFINKHHHMFPKLLLDFILFKKVFNHYKILTMLQIHHKVLIIPNEKGYMILVILGITL